MEGPGATGADMAARLRRKLVDVIHCDFFSPSGVLLPDDAARYAPVDAVYTAYALETAAPSSKQYCQALQNIVRLIRPGGYFGQMLALETTYYNMGGVLYPMNTPISLQGALDALTQCGLEVTYRKEHWVDKPLNDSDEKGHLAIVAQKR